MFRASGAGRGTDAIGRTPAGAAAGASKIGQFHAARRLLSLSRVMVDESEDIPSLTLRLLRELHTKVDRLEVRVDRLEAEMRIIRDDLHDTRVRLDRMHTEMRAGFAAVTHVLSSIDARVTRLELR